MQGVACTDIGPYSPGWMGIGAFADGIGRGITRWLRFVDKQDAGGSTRYDYKVNVVQILACTG